MAFNLQAGHSQPQTHQQLEGFTNYINPNAASSSNYAQRRQHGFDIEAWHQTLISCKKYFLDCAQHDKGVQALAAFINIRLPYQKHPNPVLSFTSTSPRSAGRENVVEPNFPQSSAQDNAPGVSLIPYIRRLIVTGNDTVEVLHGLFGKDWIKGIGELHEVERRNYLFAAKSQAWLKVKQHYDMSLDETCPFMMPLRNASEIELQSADAAWSDWLAMGDWMLGPRSPETLHRSNGSPGVKREPQE